ncbi:MAG: transglutaminase-like domain-containing protein [Bacteroides sp.]|nr:transglutaminase-like domain-containing protein [Bacteroides sp.]
MTSKIFIFLSLCIFFYTCSPKNNRLEDALIQAKGNRKELQEVLEYYSKQPKDTLKYKAACFLIENMPGHYSIKEIPLILSYYNEIDSVAKLYDFPRHKKDSLFEIISKKYENIQLDYLPDIEFISADYLIKNIDYSFSLWQDGSWAKHINFGNFCEYILPYKITEEQLLDNWKEYFEKYCIKLVNQIYCDVHINLANKACELVNRDLNHATQPTLKSEPMTVVGKMNTLANVPYGSCDSYAILSLAVMRARGIPTAIDYTPQWPFRSLGHSWNVLLDNSGKNVLFVGAMSRPGEPHMEDHKMAKVFRRTYAINSDIEDIYRLEKYIPPTFRIPFMKDVSNEYMVIENISINIKNKNNHKYAYLAVFDNKEWQPIYWGKCKGNTVTFNNMGRNIAYLPVYYTLNGIKPAASPFILTLNGIRKELVIDTLHTQVLKLYRKYPLFVYAELGGRRLAGGQIQASNDSLFQDARIIHTIPNPTQVEDVQLSGDSLTFRYWRYMSPDDEFCNIAELAFYEEDSISPVTGRIIGTEGAFENDNSRNKYAAFDKTLLTFFDAPVASGAWAGIDFGREITINRIVCIARGDGNCIEPDNEYELLYWDEDFWKSKGKKIADDFYVKYDDCPTNALFLLRNHTKGKDERIFTYENGKQIWW